jgi:hypothetical protein
MPATALRFDESTLRACIWTTSFRKCGPRSLPAWPRFVPTAIFLTGREASLGRRTRPKIPAVRQTILGIPREHRRASRSGPFPRTIRAARSTVGHSRWNERSHYAGQVAAVILALLTFIPSNHALSVPASASGEIRTIASIQTAAMYELDKRLYVHDEPWVLRDAPSVKSEPASLPSVRAVSVPTRVVDKPAHLRGRRPVPSYHYTAQPSAHRPDNQR